MGGSSCRPPACGSGWPHNGEPHRLSQLGLGNRHDIHRVVGSHRLPSHESAVAGVVEDLALGGLDRRAAQVTVNSDLERLNVMVPRDVYQPGCLNSLYDGLCQVSRSAFTVTGAATSASNATRTTFSHALGQPAGHFDLGVITMTSGANAGASRTVKQHTSGQIVALQPWGFAVSSGDTFSVSAGCNKTQATCTSKFSNLARFRGMPYIPQADTIT